MTLTKTALCAALPLCLLAACEGAPTPEETPSAAPGGTTSAAPSASPPAPDPGATPAPPIDDPKVNDGYPDLTPAPLTPEAERTATGATNVLISWARALELKEWDQAWALLSPADQRKWPKTEWGAQFADLEDIMVAFDGGKMEGAAGSSYYRAPIRITAKDRDGRPIAYTGEALLRRVNDVPGASPAQLKWHFERLTLDWTH